MASYRELVDGLDALVRAVTAGKTLPATSAMIVYAQSLVAEARKGRTSPVQWTAFEPVNALPMEAALIEKLAYHFGLTVEETAELVASETNESQIYLNSRYQVALRHLVGPIGGMVWLSIRRIDQEQSRSWRDLQRIKNELVDPEWEAVEVFPAESRLVDTSNQYHLWCFPTRLRFGFDEGLVAGSQDAAGIGEHQTAKEETP